MRPAAGAGRGQRTPGPLVARLERVSAGFAGRPVLADVSLELAAGTVTHLSGANGSGKSTLLRVLAGLHVPDAGRVFLGASDITALPPERRFPAIGLVGQEPGRHLLTERVDNEVAFALRWQGRPAAGGRRGGWGYEAERAARVRATLRELDLDALADRHPLDLSVGQRERVALAAIMVATPALLVLDEPTRGMDPAHKAALAALLRARAADGAAVLIATHDAVFARAASDRLLGLEDGRLTALPGRTPAPARP